jgi:hypothetical protein
MAEMVQPDVVGNYLAAYNSATDRRTAAADRQRNMQRQDVADEMARQAHSLKIAQEVADMLGNTADGDEAGFERAKQRWTQMGLPPEAVASFTAADLPALRVKAGTQLRDLQIKIAQSEAELNPQLKRAQIDAQKANAAQSYAAALASRAAAKGGGPGGINNASFDNISGLRKEFVGQVKDYQSVRDAYGRIKTSAENPSAAGDMSLIFNYMKVLDPGSTVREGEFATAQQATGIPERIVNAYNQAISGQRLNDKQREDFVGRAGMLFQRQHQTYLSTKKNYDDLASRFGFDPTLVTMDQSAGLADQPAGPPVPQPMTWGGAAPAGLGGTQAAPAAAGKIFDEADRILGIRK